MLLYTFATGNMKTPERVKMVVEYICTKKIASQAQLTGSPTFSHLRDVCLFRYVAVYTLVFYFGIILGET